MNSLKNTIRFLIQNVTVMMIIILVSNSKIMAQSSYSSADKSVINSDNSSNGSALRLQTNTSQYSPKSFTLFNDSQRLGFYIDENNGSANLGIHLMSLLKNGNFGIGTSSPTSKLHINGNLDSRIGASIVNSNSGSNARSDLRLGDGNGAHDLLIMKNSLGRTSYGGAYGASVWNIKGNLRLLSGGGKGLMIADVTGNVGIGTEAPHSNLHVASSVDAILKLDANTGKSSDANNARIEMTQEGGNVAASMGFNQTLGNVDVFRIGARFYDHDFKNAFTINSSNGRVGLGTDGPTGNLHIASKKDAVLKLEADSDNSNEYDNPLIEMSQDGGLVSAYIGFNKDWGHDNVFRIGAHQGTGYHYNAFTINTINGRVGIGTESPVAELDVAGKIKADEVTLNIGTFPDYVFKSDYELLSLKEVESFINENGRLPKMPSENEVLNSGMDVGQINVLLVEKVEELTLYGIAQQKEVAVLKAEVDDLKNMIKEMMNNKK